jgi:hypothetical protein
MLKGAKSAGLNLSRDDIIRYIVQGVLTIIEGFTVVSVALNLVFLPIGTAYPNIASAAILILPVLVGSFSKRVEVAVVLAVLPFFILALVYTTVYTPIWNIDIVYLGTLAGRISGAAFLLGGLGAFGWMLRRIILREAPVSSN